MATTIMKSVKLFVYDSDRQIFYITFCGMYLIEIYK